MAALHNSNGIKMPFHQEELRAASEDYGSPLASQLELETRAAEAVEEQAASEVEVPEEQSPKKFM